MGQASQPPWPPLLRLPVLRSRRVVLWGWGASAGRLGINADPVPDLADTQGSHMKFPSMDRAVAEYRATTFRERKVRRRAFFAGREEAEEEDRGRG